MDRANLGFAFFLVLLLLAPTIPVPGFGNASASLAVAGLVLWFMLAPKLPVRAVLSMPTVLGLIGFAIYALLISFASGSLVSIAYATQYAFYAVLGGMLIPAYLMHRVRQGRDAEVWRILAWVGAIYVAGIIVSLWTGPIWAFREPGGKHYGSLLILRAAGFAESVNAAGGIAALVSVLYLFVYPPSRLKSAVLVSLSLTGLVLTLSRSAIVAFISAMFLLGALFVFRALFLRGKIGRLRVRLVPIGLVVLVVAAGVVSYYQQPMVAAAWERLVLDEDYLDQDVDARLQHWDKGVERWVDGSTTEQIIGAGIRSGGKNLREAFSTSHNFYIEVLVDFGVIGLLIFLAIMAASMIRATGSILLYPNLAMARFCLCGLAVLFVHNLTEVFFYDIATLIWLILLLACNELAGKRAAAMAGGADRPDGALFAGGVRDSGLRGVS